MGIFGSGLNCWVFHQISKAQQNLVRFSNEDKAFTNFASNDVVSLFVDQTGLLWAGTWNRGSYRLDFGSNQFKRYLQAEFSAHRAGTATSAMAQIKITCIGSLRGRWDS